MADRHHWARAAMGGLALLACTLTASAQPAQRDIFNGQFGAMEIALPPREAAAQADLMRDALAALPPQTPGQMDIYILSAAFWGEPVFEREASHAAEILEEHFGANAHSIVLTLGAGANPGERRYPMASPNNLQATIGKIGSLIDPAEDLVVLFLTSHGSQDGSVSVLQQNRLASSLRPAHLRDALSNAGIRNRVVIVSACFSGAFIAPLMDANTIVLTAAAPDRTSFGCQPSREWTYFGDAYFNTALRNGAGIVAGFDQATALISRWEREQNLTPPSNPQKYVGANAAAMVTRAERRR
ncbi:MAG: C13 family peptidase [Caulobacterales bacterium]